ncbi:MAG: hypothetical protein HQK51_08435 [Oligoflexia bacterium]|nr:hypothetical protein [Oligoflexia bacterium]
MNSDTNNNDCCSGYYSKYKQYNSSLSKLNHTRILLSRSKRILFFLFIFFIFLSSYYKLFSINFSIIPFLLFIVIFVIHEILTNKIKKLKIFISYYDFLIKRITHQWIGKGFQGAEFVEESNLYAKDLDIFGLGSLFERVCLSNTKLGQQKFADYLQYKPTKNEIQQRQKAIKELTNELDLREQLHFVSYNINANLNAKSLAAWSSMPPIYNGFFLENIFPIILTVLSISTTTALFFTPYNKIFILFFFILLIIEQVIRITLLSKCNLIIRPLSKITKELNSLSEGLYLYENKNFQSLKNKTLISAFKQENRVASLQIKKLYSIKVWLDSCSNQLFAAIAFFLMLEIILSFSIERWRKQNASHITNWLDAFAELEALNSIAAFAFENPEYAYPTITDTSMTFYAQDLGHPLINKNEVVCNDIKLDSSNRILMVSGSNMSGKSTLLRTIGINSILSFIGSPVKSQSLYLSIFDIGANTRFEDSLAKGISKFYFEINRLSEIYKKVQVSSSSLILLDEIFNGTNSHDRKQGVMALIKELLKNNVLTIITTHDLALTEIKENMNCDTIRNIHFNDNFKDGKLFFDYKIKDGIIKKSNALELMKLVGLPV